MAKITGKLQDAKNDTGKPYFDWPESMLLDILILKASEAGQYWQQNNSLMYDNLYNECEDIRALIMKKAKIADNGGLL